MLEFIRTRLKRENIDCVSCIPLAECTQKRPYLLERASISQGSVIIFAVPYLTKHASGKKNISAYAVSQDYHIFFEDLFASLLDELRERFPNSRFAAFSDHSPIDEVEAAARAGLGVIGENHLLITEKFSSFVFIGEIITDALLPYSVHPIRHCEGCGKCRDACPVALDTCRCLSALTQKKGELDENQKDAIINCGSVWGCDICQDVCPHSIRAIKEGSAFSNIDFFNQAPLPYITSELISSLTDEDFKKRAFSWRGKDTVLRNLLISEGKNNGETQKNE